jgi:hypothetical protein
LGGVKNPEEEETTSRGDAAFERTYGTGHGRRPRRENPKSGTGMKQGRQMAGGAKRRESEKL